MSEPLDLGALIENSPPKTGIVRFIAVDGHGGSGKSTLARWLADRLGAELVTQDDFASWDNPLDWWPQVIKKIFVPVSQGAKTLSYPRSQWWEHHKPEPVVDQPVTDMMILEGVSSSRSEFRDYISLSIFVDTPIDLCLRRGVERDKVTGKSEEELTEMWKGWMQAEETYFNRDNPKENADVVIDGTRPFEEQVKL